MNAFLFYFRNLMKVPLFFLSLFFLLQFGNVNSFAGTVLSFQYQPVSLKLNPKVVEYFNITDQRVFFNNYIQPEENKTFIFEDLEDQDSCESSSKKVKCHNGLLSIFRDECCFEDYAIFLKPSPFLWRTRSQRYILQRTLRI